MACMVAPAANVWPVVGTKVIEMEHFWEIMVPPGFLMTVYVSFLLDG